ncbi:MAG: glutathione peroxidase [Gammaproteobacteria bacterium]
MKNSEGKTIPAVTFRCRENGDWLDITSESLFAGKRVVLFALPGAFTPTCSASHLPRYEELYSQFRNNGIDEVICLSVNDGFVMEAWGRDQQISQVRMIADGNGAFTAAMGMLVDKDDLGFGQRSWRYSMLVEDGVVAKMFIESEQPGDPFSVSDADTMLRYLKPDAELPEAITLFTKPGCGHCAKAKALLQQRGLVFDEIVVGRDASQRALRAVSGEATVPQVFIGGERIGGAEALIAYLN